MSIGCQLNGILEEMTQSMLSESIRTSKDDGSSASLLVTMEEVEEGESWSNGKCRSDTVAEAVRSQLIQSLSHPIQASFMSPAPRVLLFLIEERVDVEWQIVAPGCALLMLFLGKRRTASRFDSIRFNACRLLLVVILLLTIAPKKGA